MQYAPTNLSRRDTAQWVFQTWASFGISLIATFIGAWNLPSNGLDMAFIMMAAVFSLFSSLALSKMLRDNQAKQVDVKSWTMAVWIAFLASCALTVWGILRIEVNDWHRGFLALACLYLLAATFTLAKTLRDKHEADMAEASKLN